MVATTNPAERYLTIPQSWQKQLLVKTDPAKWYHCEMFIEHVYSNALKIYRVISGIDEPKFVKARIRQTTGRDYKGFANIHRYQKLDGWRDFLQDIYKDAIGYADYQEFYSAFIKANMPEFRLTDWPIESFMNAEKWANDVIRRCNSEDHTNYADIHDFIAQQKAGVDMVTMTPPQNVQDLSNYYKSKRIAAGKSPNPGMGEDGLSAILDNTSPAKYLTEHTMDEAKALVDAKMNPLIAAHEKAQAEQTPSALDAAFPRDENNEPVDDSDPTLPNRGIGMNDPKAKPADTMPEPGEPAKTVERTSQQFGMLWNTIKKDVFDHRGFSGSMNAWRNNTDLKAFAAQHTDEEVIADANKWIDNFMASRKAEHNETAQNTTPTKNGANFNETQSQGSDVPDEPQNQKPPAKVPQEPTKDDEIVEGQIVETKTPEKSLAVVDTSSKTIAARTEPNRYWLTNPAWQIDPFNYAKWAAKSRLYKGIDTEDKAMMCILKGVELGVSPTTALENVYLIPDQGGQLRTAISGVLMSALLQKYGVKIEYLERTDQRCTVRITRPDNGLSYTTTFTLEDAKKAGLTGKKNWQYPRVMISWRAFTECARIACSDIMLGAGIPIYMPEEIDPDGVYNEDGSRAA